jgi:hypothetical protein
MTPSTPIYTAPASDAGIKKLCGKKTASFPEFVYCKKELWSMFSCGEKALHSTQCEKYIAASRQYYTFLHTIVPRASLRGLLRGKS